MRTKGQLRYPRKGLKLPLGNSANRAVRAVILMDTKVRARSSESAGAFSSPTRTKSRTEQEFKSIVAEVIKRAEIAGGSGPITKVVQTMPKLGAVTIESSDKVLRKLRRAPGVSQIKIEHF